MPDLIDLSLVAPPDAVKAIDYEQIRLDYLRDLKRRLDAIGIDFDVDGLETDPLVITEEARAYREMLVLQRINDAVRCVLLASSTGRDLENLVADFNLKRRQGETDDQLRHRRQLAPEGYAVAGSADSYRFHALQADDSLAEARAIKCEANQITIALLSRFGDGSVEPATVARAQLALNKVRPLTDDLYVRSAEIIRVKARIAITIGSGPAAEVIKTGALDGLRQYADQRHGIGKPLYIDGLIGAARNATPVERVRVIEPTSDIEPGSMGAVYVEQIDVEVKRIA